MLFPSKASTSSAVRCLKTFGCNSINEFLRRLRRFRFTRPWKAVSSISMIWLLVSEISARFSFSLNNLRGSFRSLLQLRSRYFNCTKFLKCRYVTVFKLTLIKLSVCTFMNLSSASPGSELSFIFSAANRNSTCCRLISLWPVSALSSSSGRSDSSQQIPCAVDVYARKDNLKQINTTRG